MSFIPRSSTLFNGVMLKQSGEIDFGAGNRSCNLFLEILQNNSFSFMPETLSFPVTKQRLNQKVILRLLENDQTHS